MDKIINQELVVVMPVYNAAAFLQASISSILTQTYQNFLFNIIDDGSTDESATIINGFKDNRIQYFRHTHNQGIVHTLNNAFKSISTKYIVRMDADDITLPNRLQQQVDFMNNNPEISIAGSWFKSMDESVHYRPPTSHDEIAIALLDYSPIGHPTVIIRKSDWDKASLNYSNLYPHAEDFACWTKAVLNQCRLANIPEFLLEYRKHDLQVSIKFQTVQEKSVQNIRKNYIKGLFPKFDSNDLGLIFDFFSNKILSISQYKAVKKLVDNDGFQNDILNGELLKEVFRNKISLATINMYVLVSDPSFEMVGLCILDKYFYKKLSFMQRLKFPIKLIKKLTFG